jgi:hypothetical protein
MHERHERALTEIESLLPKVEPSAADAAMADAIERDAELKVLARVVELLVPYFDRLADIVITAREEVSSEVDPTRNRFRREDHAERGVLIYEDDHEEGVGTPGRLRIWGRHLYLLSGGRLLLVERDGFRVDRKRRGLRPDRHEVWASNAIEVTPAEALERIVFVEAVLDKVKEQVEMAVGLAEDSVLSSAERTAKLLKLVDGVN